MASRTIIIGWLISPLFYLFYCTNAFELSFGAPSNEVNITKTYDRNFRPNHGAVADMLSISIDSLNIRGIDEIMSKFTADFTLRTSWTDPRLAHAIDKATTFVANLPSIWFPPLFIMDSTDEPLGTSMLIKPEGEVVIIERHVSEIHCEFSFIRLPFDVQDCAIRIKAHAFSTLHLDMVWNGKIDESSVKVFDSQFKLASISQSSKKEREYNGEFRILSARVKLKRNPLKYFKSIMLPGLILTLMGYLTLFVREHPSAHAPNGVSFNFGLIRTSLSAAFFLVYQILTQVVSAGGGAGGAVLTAADVWNWAASAVQLFLFIFNLALLVHSRQPPSTSTTEEKSKSILERFGKHLILALPIGSMIFLIIYFIVYLI